MKSKGLLFGGIFLLIIGIVMRKAGSFPQAGLMLIFTGVACKTIYIFSKIKSGEYRPGKELLFLAFGLVLFMTGLKIRIDDQGVFPLLLIISGLLLKILFIIKFIMITRSARLMKEQAAK